MKSLEYAIAHSVAVTTAIVYVLCRVLIGLFPSTSFTVAKSWFHGIELNRFSTGDLSASMFLLGLISSVVTAWIIGFIFGKVYKMFSK